MELTFAIASQRLKAANNVKQLKQKKFRRNTNWFISATTHTCLLFILEPVPNVQVFPDDKTCLSHLT
jgi:hypothetical protein